MSMYGSKPQSYSGSPERYIPKVQQRKQQAETDWAELVRYQQAIADQMIQQEKQKRMQQKQEFRNALGTMVDEKQALKAAEQQNKQTEFINSITKKEEFNQYLLASKEHKNEFQKALISEYDRERMEKETMRKNITDQEKQIDHRMLNDALDSLNKEKAMREQKRNEFVQQTDKTLREAEAKRRRELELAQQNRQEHIRLQEENNHAQDMKDLNYKLYYQRISDRQSELQQAYDRRAGHEERSRENHIQDLVKRGVVEATQKAMEDDMRRQAKRDDLFKSTIEDVKSRIENHEQERFQKKGEYQVKNQERKVFENELAEEKYMVKQIKATQSQDYKSTLQEQMRAAEELKRKQHGEMSEYEKKSLLQNYQDVLIPGLRSTKFDNQIHPQLRASGAGFTVSQFTPMPQFNSSQGTNSFGRSTMNEANSLPASASQTITSSASPYAKNPKVEAYNPITNPIPNNLQNPYLVRDIQRGMYSPRNYLAVMADRNLVASTSMTK